jgi:hypothetical protein
VVQFEFGRSSGWRKDWDQNPPRDWKVFTLPPLQTPALGKIRHDVVYDAVDGDIGKKLRGKNPARTPEKSPSVAKEVWERKSP